MSESAEVLAAREKLKARFAGVTSQTGGKGTVRRKKRVNTKASTTDDKKLQGTFKRMGAQPIPGIEEVNLFLDDNKHVINFINPKVQAAVGANTFIVSGPNEKKEISEMLPNILSQLDQEKLISKLQEAAKEKLDSSKIAAKDADIPELVPDFEEVSEAK